MAKSNKKLYINLALGFGVLIGFILSMFAFMPPRDLKDYTRLKDGEGKYVQAVSEGGVGSAFSGRRGGSTRYCTSWAYELDGNERHFTDRSDCYTAREDAPSGTRAELIYDPSDLGTVFVHSDETLDELKGAQTAMRIASVVGLVVLIGSIVGLVVVRRSGATPAQPKEL